MGSAPVSIRRYLMLIVLSALLPTGLFAAGLVYFLWDYQQSQRHQEQLGRVRALASLVVMLALTPLPAALPGYAAMRGAMGAVATWVFLPSLAVTLMSEATGKTYALRISAAGLRSVDHRGGLDAFLAKARDSELSARALKIKREIEKTRAEA